VLGEHAEDRRDVGQPRVTDGGPLALLLADLEVVGVVRVAVEDREAAGQGAGLEGAEGLGAHSPPPSSASSASACSSVSDSMRSRMAFGERARRASIPAAPRSWPMARYFRPLYLAMIASARSEPIDSRVSCGSGACGVAPASSAGVPS